MSLDDSELGRSLETLKAGGSLPEAQLRQYMAALASGDDPAERYKLLFIAGLSGDRRFREELEVSLCDETHPMLARIALLGLCRYWGETERYRDVLKALADGVSWDEFDDVRIVALSIAGEYLGSNTDVDLLRSVVAATTAEPMVDEAAYRGLAMMLSNGAPVPSTFTADERQLLLRAARNRIDELSDAEA